MSFVIICRQGRKLKSKKKIRYSHTSIKAFKYYVDFGAGIG